MKDNLVQQKSYSFAVRIVRVFRHLAEKKKEYVLSKQLLRCGTSIGANIEEAIGAQSRADFFARITIAYKEARETSFWLRLLKDAGYLNATQFDIVHAEAEELCRILAAIQKTTKAKPSIHSQSPTRNS